MSKRTNGWNKMGKLNTYIWQTKSIGIDEKGSPIKKVISLIVSTGLGAKCFVQPTKSSFTSIIKAGFNTLRQSSAIQGTMTSKYGNHWKKHLTK